MTTIRERLAEMILAKIKQPGSDNPLALHVANASAEAIEPAFRELVEALRDAEYGLDAIASEGGFDTAEACPEEELCPAAICQVGGCIVDRVRGCEAILSKYTESGT